MTLTTTRRQTTRKLSGLALPDCFAASTVAAEAVELTRRNRNAADLRRVADKARRIERGGR